MDAVVSLRVRDWMKGGGGGGRKNKKERLTKNKNGNQKYESEIITGSGRLLSLRCMVFPRNAVLLLLQLLLLLLMSSCLSKQDQDD